MGNKLIILKLNKKGTTKSQYLKCHNYRILRNKQRKLQQDRKEAMICVIWRQKKKLCDSCKTGSQPAFFLMATRGQNLQKPDVILGSVTRFGSD